MKYFSHDLKILRWITIYIKIVPAICNLIECHKKRYYGIRRKGRKGGGRAIVAFYLLITNNETKYRVQLPDRCDSRTILKESCTNARACSFASLIISSWSILPLPPLPLLFTIAQTRIFFPFFPLEFSFSSNFFQGCLHFPLETFIQTVEKFRSGLITSRNFRAWFFTLENFIFLEEELTGYPELYNP